MDECETRAAQFVQMMKPLLIPPAPVLSIDGFQASEFSFSTGYVYDRDDASALPRKQVSAVQSTNAELSDEIQKLKQALQAANDDQNRVFGKLQTFNPRKQKMEAAHLELGNRVEDAMNALKQKVVENSHLRKKKINIQSGNKASVSVAAELQTSLKEYDVKIRELTKVKEDAVRRLSSLREVDHQEKQALEDIDKIYREVTSAGRPVNLYASPAGDLSSSRP